MSLFFIPISLSFIFFTIAWWTTPKPHRLLILPLAALLGLALPYPFRAYRITSLNPTLQTQLSSTSILETRPLSIPGYPNAYNPSLIPYQKGYLLSFRVKYYNLPTLIQKLRNSRTSYIGLIHLDAHFDPIAPPYLLSLSSYADHPTTTAHDARLFSLHNQIYLLFNDYGATHENSCHALYLTPLVETQDKLCPKQRAILLTYPLMKSAEKNWTPFSIDETLYLIYSAQPHLILQPDLATGHCHPVAVTQTPFPWPWGQIRGGTPAHPTPEGLLTFFHSARSTPSASFFGPRQGRNYVMGAYLFDPHPPFAIQKMVEFPLGSPEDYLQNNRRKVVFPGGIAIRGNHIHVVWGKNDDQIFLSTLDKDKLFSELR